MNQYNSIIFFRKISSKIYLKKIFSLINRQKYMRKAIILKNKKIGKKNFFSEYIKKINKK